MATPAPRKTSRWAQTQHPAAAPAPTSEPAPAPAAVPAPAAAPKTRTSLQVSIERDLLSELRNAYNFTAEDGQTWAAWVEAALREHVERCRAELGFPDGVPGSGVLAPRAGVRTGRPPKSDR